MTPSSQDLAALLADIEQAPHGDIGLDLDVMEAVWPTWQKDTITDDARCYVTSSIDAALALCARVLPGWMVENLGEMSPECAPVAGRWLAQLRPRQPRRRMSGPITAENLRSTFDAMDPCGGETPALALLAAMLRALLALAGDTSGGIEKIDKSSVAGAEVDASTGVKSDSGAGH